MMKVVRKSSLATGGMKKPHRFRPGTVALRNRAGRRRRQTRRGTTGQVTDACVRPPRVAAAGSTRQLRTETTLEIDEQRRAAIGFRRAEQKLETSQVETRDKLSVCRSCN
ncbi:uncharacterized protein LOC131151164 [Malania oleifera]|uniref:uncharacterized protein LOC131151164 n=1 Tax=Malania oleifera TaxID=397392 RepID=UPI0025AE0A98|nr:uncharacterized protein LOC131151164 [Malania oleifera]